MHNYLVTFTPLEPYFFGNEKTFAAPFEKASKKQQTGSYFIRSEDTPSQTTILGALRYMAIPANKKQLNKYTDKDKKENAKLIGESSFDLDNANKNNNSFGCIKRVSPIFLQFGQEQQLVCTPLDCQSECQDFHYRPFTYEESMKTSRGDRKFPIKGQFNAKLPYCDSYWNPRTGDCVKRRDIIQSREQIGIQATKHGKVNKGDNAGLYRREFKSLAQGYAFAVYLESDREFTDQTVFLGQCKSTFAVRFKSVSGDDCKNLETEITKALCEDIYYCWGDAYVSDEEDAILNLYNECSFVNASTRDYRAYLTVWGKNGAEVKKSQKLRRLIRAGSIFKSAKGIAAELCKPYCQQIGYNIVLVGGKK